VMRSYDSRAYTKRRTASRIRRDGIHETSVDINQILREIDNDELAEDRQMALAESK
jgi:hypothetical protein